MSRPLPGCNSTARSSFRVPPATRSAAVQSPHRLPSTNCWRPMRTRSQGHSGAGRRSDRSAADQSLLWRTLWRYFAVTMPLLCCYSAVILALLFSCRSAADPPRLIRQRTTSDSSPPKPPTGRMKQTSVGAQFRLQLSELMTVVGAAGTWYVRCVKSNENKRPWQLDRASCAYQLRCAGMMETVSEYSEEVGEKR